MNRFTPSVMEVKKKGTVACLSDDYSYCDKTNAHIFISDDSFNNMRDIVIRPYTGESSAESVTMSPTEYNDLGLYSQMSPSPLNKKMKNRRPRVAVNRLSSIPLQSLYSVPVTQDNFDVRNVSGRQGDSSWWSQPKPQQTTFQLPLSAKKLRSDNTNGKKIFQKSSVDKEKLHVEDVINPLKYAVVPSDYPRTILNDEQYAELQVLLTDELVKTTEAESMPRFWDCTMKHGSLLACLADQKSKDWLMDTVSKLTLANDIKLKVGLAKDILQTRKVSFVIPTLIKDLELDKILKLIKLQNAGVRPDFWQILESEEVDRGERYYFSIDEESFNVIRNSHYNIHLGLGVVNLAVDYYNVTFHSSDPI